MALNTRTCEICHSQVLLKNVKLFPRDPDKNILCCENCCEQLKLQQRAKQGKPMVGPVKIMASDIIEDIAMTKVKERAKQTNRDAYFCTRCRYNFTVDSDKAGKFFNLHCPYCGRDDRLERR